jgi:cellulose synthase/poly-beta-1,6-N-acetylglucosamine synthase-like glycosyltransferase
MTALQFLSNQSLDSLLSTFWILVYVEVPRFFVGAVVLGWFLLFRKDAPHPDLDGQPARRVGISVVVAGHNAARAIQRTLASLREQTLSPLQIIVVNDGSTDESDRICRRLAQLGVIDTYISLRSRGGKAAAVNAGLARARHPLFLVTDADTTFDRDALARASAAFADSRVGVVGGNLRVRNKNASLAAKVQQLNYGFSITLGRIVRDALGFYFVASGAFGMYRTRAVRAVGGWDVGPGEDGDILTRLRLAGWQARFAYRATAMTDVPVTFVALARQRLRWDRSMIRNRYRKAGPAVLYPFRPGFHAAFAASFLEIYFFNGLVPFLHVTYLASTLSQFGAFALTIFAIVFSAYAFVSLVKFFVMLSLSTRPLEDLRLLPYFPLYALTTNLLLRVVKLYANANELIVRGSYNDSYVPRKVRQQTEIY